MTRMHDPYTVPEGIPTRKYDGAADGLPGTRLPSVPLTSTSGGLRLPFDLLSGRDVPFAEALGLPTFEVEGKTLLKRLTMIVEDGQIRKVFYPVFPPGRDAQEVIDWLSTHK